MAVISLLAFSYYFFVYDEDGQGCLVFLIILTVFGVLISLFTSGYLLPVVVIFVILAMVVFIGKSFYRDDDSYEKTKTVQKETEKPKRRETEKSKNDNYPEKPKRGFIAADGSHLEVVEDSAQSNEDPRKNNQIRRKGYHRSYDN